MKKILGAIVLVFTLSVFMSCNKTNDESEKALVKEAQSLLEESKVLLKTAKEAEKAEFDKSKEIGVSEECDEDTNGDEEADNQKEAKAQFYLGMKYANDKSSPRNLGEAVKCFQKSSERGYGEAQHSLGLMYFQGKGINQDYVKAYKWASLAAAQNKKHAQLRDLIESKLTKEELIKAKVLVSDFIPQNK